MNDAPRAYKRLFIWVEGPDDSRFFRSVLLPVFNNVYDHVDIVEYAEMRFSKIQEFIRSINSMGADYIFTGDKNHRVCVTLAREALCGKIGALDDSRVFIIVREIECWYLAVLPQVSSPKLGLQHIGATDDLTKEHFNSMIPPRFSSRVDCLIEILKFASLEEGRAHNDSFDYFMDRCVTPLLN